MPVAGGRMLGIAVAGASACSMALEIAAGRMIAPYVGMSLYSWTAVIAVVLAGLTLGHWIGGRLADAPGDAPRRMLGVALALAAVFSIATIPLLRAISGAAVTGGGPVWGAVVIAALVFGLPSLFAGTVAPLATFLALRGAGEGGEGRVLGRMFALGAGGAILGTLGGGLLLIPLLGSFLTVAVIAGFYALLAVPFFLRSRAARTLAIGGVAVLSAVAGWSAQALSPCERESGTFCLRADDLPDDTRVLALDHLAHGVNDPDDPTRLVSPYLALIDRIAEARFGVEGPPEAFFLGGGAYTLPRAWAAKGWGGARVIAEVDPMVTRLAVDRLWVLPENHDIRHGDGRIVLSSLPSDRRFDAIVADAFADVSVPPHLVTDEFHADIAAHLTPGGFYAINVVDRLREPRFATSLAHTLARRFAHVEMWLDAATVRPGEARTTWVIVASDSETGSDRLRASDGTGRDWVRVPTGRMIDAVGAPMLLTDDHAPVARLLGALLLDGALSE